MSTFWVLKTIINIINSSSLINQLKIYPSPNCPIRWSLVCTYISRNSFNANLNYYITKALLITNGISEIYDLYIIWNIRQMFQIIFILDLEKHLQASLQVLDEPPNDLCQVEREEAVNI